MTDQDELTLSDDEGDDLPDEALAELAAIEDDEPADEAAGAQTSEELSRLRADLDAERAAHRAAVARYREAVLAAEPALPPELVTGDSLADVDAPVAADSRAGS